MKIVIRLNLYVDAAKLRKLRVPELNKYLKTSRTNITASEKQQD